MIVFYLYIFSGMITSLNSHQVEWKRSSQVLSGASDNCREPRWRMCKLLPEKASCWTIPVRHLPRSPLTTSEWQSVELQKNLLVYVVRRVRMMRARRWYNWYDSPTHQSIHSVELTLPNLEWHIVTCCTWSTCRRPYAANCMDNLILNATTIVGLDLSYSKET